MLPGFDFDAAVHAPFRMQPGLRRVPHGVAQLTPLGPGSRHQREKLAVLAAWHDEAMVAAPGFDATPALDALCAHAAAEHHSHFEWRDGHAKAPGLGLGLDAAGQVVASKAGAFGLGDELPRCLDALPRHWRLPGLLSLTFAEDFAIVDGTTGRIPWLAVALPSRWAPRHKVGGHFAEIHAPVADSATLLAAGAHLMRLVCGHDRWERFVWNVTDHPRLNAHPLFTSEVAWDGIEPTPDAVGAAAWFRSERQSFVSLPSLQQAVFTIGVDVVSLASVAALPARARLLHDAVASMTPAVLEYRRLDRVRTALLTWLEHRAAA